MRACRWITLGELEGRIEEWHELAVSSEFPTVFADPAWVLAWWRTYGEGHDPWCFAMEDDDGSLRGLAVLACRRGTPFRTLTFAGGRWNGLETLLSARGLEPEFSARLLEELAARRREWDVWSVERLPAASTLARTLLHGRGTLQAAAHAMRYQPFLPLPGSVTDFEARFGDKHDKEQRRKRRRLAELGARTRLVSEPAEVRTALEAIVEFKRRRGTAQRQHGANTHMDSRYERFLITVVRDMPRDGVRLWAMEADGEPLALVLNLVEGPREHGLLLGLGEKHTKLSPGNALAHHAIVQAISEGREELDLGPGQDAYKYRLGAVDRRLVRVRVASPSRRGRISGAIAAIDLSLRNSSTADTLRTRRGLILAQEKAPATNGGRHEPTSSTPESGDPAGATRP